LRVIPIAVLAACVALASAVWGGLANTHHDFSSASWGDGEMCSPCHTPHNADSLVSAAPLWNHAVTTATFTLYGSDTLDAVPGQPTGATRLCLSCHDGTVALDSFDGVTGGGSFIADTFETGTDLSRHHPVSFDYDSDLASQDGDLKDPSTAPSGLGGTIAEDLLRNGRLECSSCHDVHVSRATGSCGGCHAAHGPMKTSTLSLWKSNAGSALCLTCHVK